MTLTTSTKTARTTGAGEPKLLPLWQREPEGALFDACPYAPLKIFLTAHTTREVLNETLTKHSGETRYLLIDRLGMFRDGGYRYMQWGNALKEATASDFVIYNARTHKTSRPVWHQTQYLQRKLSQRTIETVRLVPYLPATEGCSMRRLRSIFYIEVDNAEG